MIASCIPDEASTFLRPTEGTALDDLESVWAKPTGTAPLMVPLFFPLFAKISRGFRKNLQTSNRIGPLPTKARFYVACRRSDTGTFRGPALSDDGASSLGGRRMGINSLSLKFRTSRSIRRPLSLEEPICT